MFGITAQLVERFWFWLLAGWIAVLAVLSWQAPDWNSVAEEGEFNFLPPDSPTRQGETLLKQAFPEERGKSRVVLVLSRSDGQRLTDADKAFITKTLKPRLQKLAETLPLKNGPRSTETAESVILGVETFADETTGALLISRDGRATLVNIELATKYIASYNREIVGEVEALLENLRRNETLPPGLTMALTGSAVVGRDELQTKSQSADNIHTWTIWLVVGLLLIVYRAPILALIPLVTLFVAVETTLKLTAVLAGAGYLGVFSGQEIYTTVIVYGAGVDFCLFLLSRYQEELQNGLPVNEAVSESIRRVGTAVAASAATQIAGIGMLIFMSFRKFQQAGFSIALGFLFMLLASLLLAPALLRLTGRFAFWPLALSKSGANAGATPPFREAQSTGDAQRNARDVQQPGRNLVWERVGRLLRKHPGGAWLVTVLVMLPFAFWGMWNSERLSYGILSELPDDAASRHGTTELMQHFPAGRAGAVKLLLRNDEFEFTLGRGENAVQAITQKLWAQRKTLHIADIRSLSRPRGFHGESAADAGSPSGFGRLARRAAERRLAHAHYVSSANGLDDHVTRMTLILSTGPFERETIDHLDKLQTAVAAALPAELSGSTLYVLGSTANLRDLKTVAEQDWRRIQVLVTTVVLLVLVAMLRRVAVPVYLIMTVLFSFFATMGVTFLVFEWWEGEQFAGLDWTVPIFLFTVLIAVGEDYNVFLLTRVDEEQQRHGPVAGITQALSRTGGIISGCGVIMAGTFSSLLVGGQLAGMQQLGFALSFGVLVDTFVVRTVLVPAYLILVNSNRFRRRTNSGP